MIAAPWDALERATLGTCEPDVAGWIVHPAETVSSLSYLAVAVALWLRYRQADHRLPVRFLPTVVSSIGLASLLFHASSRAPFQTLDLAVITLFTGYFLAASLVHRCYVTPPRLRRLVVVLAALGAAAPQIHLALGFAMVTLQAAAVLWIWRGPWLGEARRDARRATWLLVPGAVLLGLDHAGIGCVGQALEHVVQPHAAWHVVSAMSVWYLYRAERLLERGWSEGPAQE